MWSIEIKSMALTRRYRSRDRTFHRAPLGQERRHAR
jgi:hypothetical protein